MTAPTPEEELLDVCDANMAPRGVATRARVHAEGLWHRVVHIWLASPRDGGALLFQRRSAKARSFPGRYDATVGGHLRAGEALADAFREAEEELGVRLRFADARHLGWRVAVGEAPRGEGSEREFQAVFLMRAPEPFAFAPADGEADGIAFVPNAAGLALHAGRVDAIRCAALDAAGREGEVTLAPDSFVPRPPGYHAAMHIMAERLLEGREDLAI